VALTQPGDPDRNRGTDRRVRADQQGRDCRAAPAPSLTSPALRPGARETARTAQCVPEGTRYPLRRSRSAGRCIGGQHSLRTASTLRGGDQDCCATRTYGPGLQFRGSTSLAPTGFEPVVDSRSRFRQRSQRDPARSPDKDDGTKTSTPQSRWFKSRGRLMVGEPLAFCVTLTLPQGRRPTVSPG
jgi:hypothetical protein